MSRKRAITKRAFTRSQVEEAFHRTHVSDDSKTYTIHRVELLDEVSPPCWCVEFNFVSHEKRFHHFGQTLFIQRTVAGQAVLNIALATPVPAGLASVEEEDTAIQEEWRQFVENEHKEAPE